MMTLIEVRDGIEMALGALRANKFRAFMTILGVMIGVSSVICMASIINGMQVAAEKEIDSMGSNIIMITRFEEGVDHDEMTEEQRNRPPITINEALAVQKHCPTVDGVSPQNGYFKPGGNEVKYRNRKASGPRITGIWPDYLAVNNKSLTVGRFITETDDRMGANVCVIGATICKALFEDDDPLGKKVRANGNEFEVIGVIEEVKSSFGNDEMNNSLLMPLRTFERIHPWEKELLLVAKARSTTLIGQAEEEIIGALRIERKVPFNKPNDFALATQESFKETVGNITKYIYLAMLVITSVGLMVGGIGVMNIMLVSVTERTREIGIRKAIGARRINILLQFLTEATTLSGAGGIIGIIFGVLLGMAGNALFHFPQTVSFFWIILGFVVAVSVGLVSGMYPAIKASRLDPIDALRYE